jgi:hypothetical protein
MRQRGLLEPGTQLLSKPYPKSALAEAVRELLDLSDEAVAAARTER